MTVDWTDTVDRTGPRGPRTGPSNSPGSDAPLPAFGRRQGHPLRRSLSFVDEEELLRVYFGTNAEKFLTIHRKTEQKGWASSFNWAVLFFPVIWFLYRKMYITGAFLVLMPFVLVALFPDVGFERYLGIAFFLLAFSANGLYVASAQWRIESFKKRGLAQDALESLVRKSGGTSVPGAVLGAMILAVQIVLIVMAFQVP